MKKLADYFIINGQYNEAIILYSRVQEIYPYAEDSYFRLMQLYGETSNRFQVEQQYEKLTKMLLNQFCAKPNQDVQIWYECWKNKIGSEKLLTLSSFD